MPHTQGAVCCRILTVAARGIIIIIGILLKGSLGDTRGEGEKDPRTQGGPPSSSPTAPLPETGVTRPGAAAPGVLHGFEAQICASSRLAL